MRVNIVNIAGAGDESRELTITDKTHNVVASVASLRDVLAVEQVLFGGIRVESDETWLMTGIEDGATLHCELRIRESVREVLAATAQINQLDAEDLIHVASVDADAPWRVTGPPMTR